MQAVDVLCISLMLMSASSVSSGSFVSLDSAGYQNVLFRIQPDVPYDSEFVNQLQDAISQASRALCVATNSKTFLNNVTIMVPNEWAEAGEYVNEMAWPRSYSADVIISQDHPQYGKQPVTLQFGFCGMEGLPMQISANYVNDSSNAKKDIQLVHEWFHYRYGVYDENGVAGDPQFPSKFDMFQSQHVESNLPNSCTDIPVNGTWIDEDWHVDPDAEATSSLMYSTALPRVKVPCTEETHQKASPNKHNFHCYGQSVAQVVFQHPDFIGNNQSKTCISPWFNTVVDPVRGYHFVVDVSAEMNSTLNFDSVKLALSHFVWYLPDGTSVSIDKFSNVAVQVQAPIILNSTTKDFVLYAISRLQEDTQSTDGLGQALTRALLRHEEGLEIVLVTASSNPSADFEAVLQMYRERLTAVHVIAVGWTTFDSLVDLARYGRHYVVPDHFHAADNSRSSRTWMVDTFHSIHSHVRKYRPKVAEWSVDFQNGWNNGSFYIDTAGTKLLFSFYSLSDVWRLIGGNLYGPSGTECFIIGTQPSDAYTAVCNGNIEPGQWRFSINILLNSPVVAHFDVWIQSDSEFVTLSTWTSSRDQQAVDWNRNPLVIYAHVHQQRRAVNNVTLVAKLIGKGADSIEIPLDESNFADVTWGDGIYSGPVLNLPAYSTVWTYVIEVRNQNGFIDAGSYGQHPSSGSLITQSNAIAVGPFTRFAYGQSIRLAEAYDPGSAGSKPGRVTDLRIVALADNKVNLTWTAPKGNFGTSDVYVYRFKITGQSKTEEELFQGEINPSPGSADVIEKSLDLPSGIGGLYYLRVYGIDALQGPPSNILAIRIDNPDGPNVPEEADELVWILVGTAVGLALVGLIILTVFCIRTRPKCCCQGKTSVAESWIEHGSLTHPPKNDPAGTDKGSESGSILPNTVVESAAIRPTRSPEPGHYSSSPKSAPVYSIKIPESAHSNRVPNSAPIRPNPILRNRRRVETSSESSGRSDYSGYALSDQESSSVADLGELEESTATWRYVAPVNEPDDLVVVPERRVAPAGNQERIYDVPNAEPRIPAKKMPRPTIPPPLPPSYVDPRRSSSPTYLASRADDSDDDGRPAPAPLRKAKTLDFLELIAQETLESVV